MGLCVSTLGKVKFQCCQPIGIIPNPPPKIRRMVNDDTITASHLRTGGGKVSPWRCVCHGVFLFVFLARRGCGFCRIFFVGGRLKYHSTSAHPPPQVSGKPHSRWIQDNRPGPTVQQIERTIGSLCMADNVPMSWINRLTPRPQTGIDWSLTCTRGLCYHMGH